jgi:D-xylose transport system permease protein
MILDEPTAALGVAQTGMVLGLVRRLAEQGYGVIIVSHNLNDVFEVADRIAVLRLGHLVAEGPASDYDRQSVVELMTTGTVSSRAPANGFASAAAASGTQEV